MAPIPDLERIPPVGDRPAVGGDDIVGNIGIANLIKIDAVEDILELTMVHNTVVDMPHPDRGIEGDRLLSAVGDGEVF